MNKEIVVTLNPFGPYIKKENIENVTKFGNLQGTAFEATKDQLELFFRLPFNALTQEILQRYIEITNEDTHIFIAPHTKELFDRLVKPLSLAKKSYCLGDYLSTIASCGVVGEMLAILIWKINEVKLGSSPISEDDEKGLFSYTFESLSQDRRLRVLKTFKFITEGQYNNFIIIKNNRKRYLHLWNINATNEKDVALETLRLSFQLFKEITGIGLASAGTVKVNPLLIKLFDNL